MRSLGAVVISGAVVVVEEEAIEVVVELEGVRIKIKIKTLSGLLPDIKMCRLQSSKFVSTIILMVAKLFIALTLLLVNGQPYHHIQDKNH